MPRTGRPPKISSVQREVLVRLTTDNPTITLCELQAALQRETGLQAHEATISKSLREAGVKRIKPSNGVHVETAPASKKRYGYTDAHRRQAPEQRYPSCLTDAEWALVKDVFDHDGGRGTPRHSRRLLVDACCYVVRTGGSWRMLPKEFPAWQNVYRTFRRWSSQGSSNRCMTAGARVRGVRKHPRRWCSMRSSPQGGAQGYDAGKKVKGRKRHLVVDTLGLLLAVSVTAASVQDRDGAHPVVAATMAKYPHIETLFVDVQVVRHPANKNVGRWLHPDQPDLFTVKADERGFVVLAKRWVVEQTHAWNERARRLVMHHDRLPQVSEAWVWLTEARLLLRRLTA